MKHPIVIIGLNPAWQRVLSIPHFKSNEINRIDTVIEYASGKGINCAQILKKVGGDGVLLQCVGGTTGEQIVTALNNAEIKHHSIPVSYKTRICQTVCDSFGAATEIIEPSGTLTGDERTSLNMALKAHLLESSAFVVTGTAPNGMSNDFFLSLKERPAGVPLFVDCVQQLDALLSCDAALLKINRDELECIVGERDSVAGWKTLSQKYGLTMLIVTDGGEPVYMHTERESWQFELPKVDELRNSIGAGDTLLGAYVHHFVSHKDPCRALTYALGVALAKCEVAQPFDTDLARAKEYSQKIILRDITELSSEAEA